MKLNPFKSFYFRKKALFTLESAADTNELASIFAHALSNGSGLKKIGLSGEPGSGKTAFANAWLSAVQPLETQFDKIVLDRPFRLLKKPNEDFYIRHYDAAMLHFAPEEEKRDLTSFSAYFRDVNPLGFDLVEHPAVENPSVNNGQNGNFNYILHFEKVSSASSVRKLSLYPSPVERQSEGFQTLLEHSDDGYRCFKKVMGVPLLP